MISEKKENLQDTEEEEYPRRRIVKKIIFYSYKTV